MSIGPAEILVILIVALLVFGPERLPQVGRQVGAAVRELRKMQDTVRGELDMVLHPEHGTAPGDQPYEPGDHSTYAGYGDESADGTPAALEPPPFETGETASDFTSSNGSSARTRPDGEDRFHGPPDSFI